MKNQQIALGDYSPEKVASAFQRRIPNLGEDISHASQPLCDRLRVKPYTRADAE